MARSFTWASTNRIVTGGSNSGVPVTYAGWFYEVSRQAGQPSHTLWSANSAVGGTPFNEMNSNNGVLQWAYESTGWISTGLTLPASVWAHVAMTASGGTHKTYLNGGSPFSNAYSGSAPRRLPVVIGAWAQDSTTLAAIASGFDGTMAHFAAWDVALTASEILSLSQGMRPSAVRAGSLIGYWPLSGSVPNYEPDLTPYANNGTLSGTVFRPDPPLLPNANQILVTIPAEGEMPGLFVAPSFISGWSRQSNLPVIGGGPF